MSINLRQKYILDILINKESHVTITEIAKKIAVSNRTVIRELGTIEQWVDSYDCKLEKKSGKGIFLEGKKENIKRILDSLEKQPVQNNYSPEYRKIYIVSKLLQSREAIKFYSLAKKLYVTEGTISNDLDKLEGWFEEFDIKLVRKPGVGVYLKGTEVNFRNAIISFVYENYSQEKILDLAINETNDIKILNEKILNLISNDVLIRVGKIVRNNKSLIEEIITDNTKMRLIVHIALVIERTQKDEDIFLSTSQLNKMKKYQEFEIAWYLAKIIEEEFEIKISDEEIAYITMHLRGLKYYMQQKSKSTSHLEYSKALARKMIKVAEAKTGLFLSYDEYLIMGLVNHLELAIERLKMNMQIRNPLIQDIKDFYPELFELATKCSKAIEEDLGIEIPEGEIGYIAMHIAAAMEKGSISKNNNYRVIISCITGIGSSTLLASRVAREYSNFTVVDVLPTIEISEEMIKENKVDFIISTVPIYNLSIPVITVSPILHNEDKEKFEKFIKNIKISNKYLNEEDSHRKGVLKDNALKLRSYMNGIIDVLDNFFILELKNISKIEMIIDEIVNKIEIDKLSAIQLKDDFIAREKIGTTILRGYETILLHCKSKAASKGYFGVVKLSGNSFIANDEGYKECIKLVVVMVAPEQCDKAYREVFSHLCEMLISEEGIIENLYNKGSNELLLMFDNSLEIFYKERAFSI